MDLYTKPHERQKRDQERIQNFASYVNRVHASKVTLFAIYNQYWDTKSTTIYDKAACVSLNRWGESFR